MIRRNKVILIFSLLIIGMMAVVLLITFTSSNKNWYYFLFFINLAFLEIMGFVATLEKVMVFLDRIIGPELSSVDQKKAKKILEEIKNSGVVGIPLDIFNVGLMNEYGEEIGFRVCLELEKSEFVVRRNNNIIITEKGRKYISS